VEHGLQVRELPRVKQLPAGPFTDASEFQRIFHLRVRPKVELKDYVLDDGKEARPKALPLLEWAPPEEDLMLSGLEEALQGQARKHLSDPATSPREIPAALPSKDDIVVYGFPSWPQDPERIGAEAPPASARTDSVAPLACAVQIIAGLLPAALKADPPAASQVRIVDVSLDENCGEMRVRKSLSYESIAVDLLRPWRDCDDEPRFTEHFCNLLGIPWHTEANGGGGGPRWPDKIRGYYIVTRINSAALFVYRVNPPAEGQPPKEKAWLVYHEKHPAPMDDALQGRMLGYNGFISSSMADRLARLSKADLKRVGADDEMEAGGWLFRALATAVLMQVAATERGLLHLLFWREPGKEKEGWYALDSMEWKDASTDTSRYCKDLASHLRYEKQTEKKIHAIEIDIQLVVSHRTQWFLAMERIVRAGAPGKPDRSNIEKKFLDKAVEWLCQEDKKPEEDIPVVKIGNLALMDRREVEDYLATAMPSSGTETRRFPVRSTSRSSARRARANPSG
jgi:hypothetical protein